MYEETKPYDALLTEISQRSEDVAPDYYYNDIGPLLYVFAVSAESAELPQALAA